MTKIIENIAASELPITEIDREAAVVAYYDGVEPPTTTIHIQTGDEEIHINPFKINISIGDSVAEGIWKAYYLPMQYQIAALRQVFWQVARATKKLDLLKDTPLVISYYAADDTFFVEYFGNEFVVTGDKDKVVLKSEVAIPLLESPVFKVGNPSNVYNIYNFTKETIEMVKELLYGYPIADSLFAFMSRFEEREKFFECYNRLHNKEN